MWFAILGGIGVGLMIVMFMTLRQQRDYRMLFSDTHLLELAKAIAGARAGASQATFATFEGIAARWETLPKHVALELASRKPIAPPAAKFLLAFARELVGGATIATLQLDKRRWALVWEGAAGEPAAGLDDASLLRMRSAAADAMKSLPLTEASLDAYR